MKFKCNTYIIVGYLHSPWNLEGYCITITKPKVPSKTLIGLSFKQDIFCIRFFLQFHSCLQPGCRNEYFEEEGQRTIVFKDHPDTFHTNDGTLTFWNFFNYKLFCMSRCVETFVKMESKLNEFGMVALNACTKWNLKVVKFHAMAPREVNNDIGINGAFFFCPLICVLFFSLQNLPSYLIWIGKYSLVYITCHEVVGIHW
jgi:hypothetical protein